MGRMLRHLRMRAQTAELAIGRARWHGFAIGVAVSGTLAAVVLAALR